MRKSTGEKREPDGQTSGLAHVPSSMADFITIRCRMCDGPAHPATGCVYSPTFIVCGPCTREAWAWIRSFTASKGRRSGLAFYDHVNRIAPRIEMSTLPPTAQDGRGVPGATEADRGLKPVEAELRH
jgi:hypothetical protein